MFSGDFELPALGKISSGFDVSGNDVSGWRNAGTNQNDTGIEGSGSGNNSLLAAYLHRGQSGAYQISPTALQLGDTVTLTWDVRDSWQGVLAKVSILGASSQDAAFDNTTILAAKTNEVAGWWSANSLTFTAGATDVGKLVGVAFQSADPATAPGWANFDNFSITVTPAASAPVIITHPFSQTAWLGGTATFSVIASGSGLSYQWQAGEVGSGIHTNISNGGQFSGANAASLTVSSITGPNGLEYVVIVSNPGGSVPSNPATLTVDPNAPLITAQPVPLTRFSSETATFTVTANGAVSYFWKAGAMGGGIYTNLANGGQFSGVNSATLTITNLTTANQADYVVEVSNGGGSALSEPASLTIIAIIYLETFLTNGPAITGIGWVADSRNGQYGTFNDNGTRLRVFDSATGAQAFYTSTHLNDGSISGHMGFPVIKLADVSNLTFHLAVESCWQPFNLHTYYAVQMNWGQWYISATEMPQASGSLLTHTLTFDPNTYAWNELTVSGTGGTNTASIPLIGTAAADILTGYITGAGLVTVSDGSTWVDMDNFAITGDGFTILPGLSLTPSGSNVTLMWGYGTLVESTSLSGPWTPVIGTSPLTVSPTGGSHFYRLQLP